MTSVLFCLSLPNWCFQKEERRRRDINNTPWTVSLALENLLKGYPLLFMLLGMCGSHAGSREVTPDSCCGNAQPGREGRIPGSTDISFGKPVLTSGLSVTSNHMRRELPVSFLGRRMVQETERQSDCNTSTVSRGEKKLQTMKSWNHCQPQ